MRSVDGPTAEFLRSLIAPPQLAWLETYRDLPDQFTVFDIEQQANCARRTSYWITVRWEHQALIRFVQRDDFLQVGVWEKTELKFLVDSILQT
jgi:hypothetical protein